MRQMLTALLLGGALAGGSALAQPAAPEAVPGAAPKGGRSVTATGQTKPPSNAGTPLKPTTEAQMLKAQQETAARNKAWDAKMRSTLGSICRGC